MLGIFSNEEQANISTLSTEKVGKTVSVSLIMIDLSISQHLHGRAAAAHGHFPVPNFAGLHLVASGKSQYAVFCSHRVLDQDLGGVTRNIYRPIVRRCNPILHARCEMESRNQDEVVCLWKKVRCANAALLFPVDIPQ